MFFTHFASKNQLPGFSISGTLAGNGLNEFRDPPPFFVLLSFKLTSLYSLNSAFFFKAKVTYLILQKYKMCRETRKLGDYVLNGF